MVERPSKYVFIKKQLKTEIKLKQQFSNVCLFVHSDSHYKLCFHVHHLLCMGVCYGEVRGNLDDHSPYGRVAVYGRKLL